MSGMTGQTCRFSTSIAPSIAVWAAGLLRLLLRQLALSKTLLVGSTCEVDTIR